MPSDAFAPKSERYEHSHTEFQDRHGHSDIVSFRCLPAVVSELGRLQEENKEYSVRSEIYRAAFYEGLKVLQERYKDVLKPNPIVKWSILVEQDMDATRRKEDLVATLRKWIDSARGAQERDSIRTRLIQMAADVEGDTWLRNQIQAIVADYS